MLKALEHFKNLLILQTSFLHLKLVWKAKIHPSVKIEPLKTSISISGGDNLFTLVSYRCDRASRHFQHGDAVLAQNQFGWKFKNSTTPHTAAPRCPVWRECCARLFSAASVHLTGRNSPPGEGWVDTMGCRAVLHSVDTCRTVLNV